MICRLCKRVGIAKGLCMPHYLEAYRRKNPRRHSTRGDFQTGRAKPRSAHADRPGSDEAARNGQSHDGGLQHTATNGLLREERNG